ncbi:MAG: hypothetical protein ACKO9H_09755 [Planctomycetota bacterium]
MRQLSAKPASAEPLATTIRAVHCGLLTLSLLFAVGCGPVDQIEQHVMPRERTGIPEAVRIPAAQNQSAPAVRSRMVTAIAALPSATWFFKAVGPVEDMEATLPSLTSFFQSVRFDAQGKPEYTPPVDWKKGAARPGRYETLLLGPGGTPSVELAISELGPNQDLTSNVNRWRRDQLGLSALDDTAARESLKSLPFQGGEFLLFDEVGMYRGGMGGPMSGAVASANSATLPTADKTTTPKVASESAPPPLEFVAPAGWTQLPNPMFAAVRFERVDGEKKAAISVSEMNPSLNTWETALGSWLEELELPGLDAAQVGPFVSEVTIDGQTGKQIQLLIPDATKAIIAARVEQGGRAWFVKLAGEKSLVEKSQGDLKAFIESIRFKPATDSK